MNIVSRKILYHAVSRALRRPCPRAIPRSGSDAGSVDCFTVRLHDGNNRGILLNRISGDLVEGQLWDGKRYRLKAILRIDNLKAPSFTFVHYHGIFETRYSSPLEFVAFEMIRYPYLVAFFLKVRTWLYGLSTPVRSSRIEILKELLDHRKGRNTAFEGVFRYRCVELFEFLVWKYGERILSHPKFPEF